MSAWEIVVCNPFNINFYDTLNNDLTQILNDRLSKYSIIPKEKAHLMHVNSGIVKWIDEFIQEITWRLVIWASNLCPGMTTCKSISRSENKLFSSCWADAVDSCLVIV